MRASARLACAALIALVALATSGCNTWEGIKQDAKGVGDSISNSKKK